MNIRHSFITLILILHCSLVMGGLPPQGDDPLAKGIALFESGQFKQSYDVLLNAFTLYPENLELNFYLGRAAFETGNYEMAVMAFERILIASPYEYRVKLEIARAFQKLGDNSTATQYFREVLSTNPPEPVKKNINDFLAYIAGTERKHFFNGQIALGVDWNNNIWASPSAGKIKTIIGDIDLTGPSSEKTTDVIYNTTIGIGHTYRSSYPGYSWKTDADFYNATYDKTSALDIRYFGFDTGPELASGNNKWGLSFLLNHTELGNETYQNGVGLKTAFDHIFSPSLLSRAALKIEQKKFPDFSARDSTNASLVLGFNFLHNKNWYGLGFKAEREDAANSEYSYNRYGLDISVSRQLPFNIAGSISYAYQFSRYDEKASLFGKNREDHQHTAGGSLKKMIWQSSEKANQTMSINLNYQHIWAVSNIELYEFNQDLLQVFLVYDF